jgi:hypothetical protein
VKINPDTAEIVTVATGLAGATGRGDAPVA